MVGGEIDGVLPEKKLKKDGIEEKVNILDKLTGEMNQSKTRQSLFHKSKEVENATTMFFRNCRFGIR